MTGDELRGARGELGQLWGLGRPLSHAEMAAVLRLAGADPAGHVRDYERGKSTISGPMSLAIELMLDGAKPRNLAEIL